MNFAQPDVTLLLDMTGVIREATLSDAFVREGTEAWLGRPWLETVNDHGGDKVRRMIDETRSHGICAFRQMMQAFPSGLELPMEYTTVLLGGRAGIMAIGKHLKAVAELQTRLIAAQQTMERDHWRIRDIETRYRLLFEASSEAVLLVRASNLRIVEANPAAVRAIGLDGKKVDAVGRDLLHTVQAQDREPLQATLRIAGERGKAPGVLIHIGAAGTPWIVRASLMAADEGQAYLLQLTPALAARSADAAVADDALADLVEQVPDGFVIVDETGTIRRANRAFASLIEVGGPAAATGQRLARWLGRPGADVPALLDNVRRHGTVKLFNSSVSGELGTETDVEISAAARTASDGQEIVLLVREIGRRLPAAPVDDHLQAMLGTLTAQIGKTPLRKLVKDTVVAVEREYVKAALDLANGKRTAAAELLGLSRQSLYAKLDRYGLADTSFPASDPDG